MNAPDKFFLPDIQAAMDLRQLAIQQVGIRDLQTPITVRNESGEPVHTVGRWTMTVGLAAEVKGTHMSRFVELLDASTAPLTQDGFASMFHEMLQRLEATSGRIAVDFPYFMRKSAPVSGVSSLLDYQVTWRIEKRPHKATQMQVVVRVPVTSLCPCSKEISDYGAHNQRSIISIGVALRRPMALESLIRIAEAAASCEVYGLLKRPDEKFVTERAYDNPKFVEDLVRDIALCLMNEAAIERWQVISENFESIHNHSAYAELSGCNA